MLPRINIPEQKKEIISKNELDNILLDALIDTTKQINRPPVICEIRTDQGHGWQRLFTLGNFSAIIGKAKSRKTFFSSLLIAALTTGKSVYNHISGKLMDGKKGIIRIDTEQSIYDTFMVARRDEKLSGIRSDDFAAFSLREFSPLLRCEIVEHILKKFNGQIGYMIIDGIADLATAINDEIEATRIVSLLLRWTKEYNCHISVVIHQNKSNSFATGHLGSAIMKKAEVVISVDKSEENPTTSVVSCNMIRGVQDFEPFLFKIDGDGLPVILGNEGVNSSFENIF